MREGNGKATQKVSRNMETIVNERGGKQSRIDARFTSIPAEALVLVAECFGFGASKYGDTNWHKITKREHLDHALLHHYRHLSGDSSEPHLVNAAVRSLMALQIAIMEEGHATTYEHPELINQVGESSIQAEKGGVGSRG
jgi:hypothetical protein